jgi:hypothetical protein
MSDNICLPKNYIIIIFCLFIGLTTWYIHIDKNIRRNMDDPNYKYNDNILNKILKKVSETDKNNIFINNLEKRKLLDIRDSEVLYNNFAPPERRVPEHVYPTKELKQMINIPTRGIPENYQILGIVSRENTETAYNLYGRQTFPSSNQYEYYVQSNMDGNIVKIPITRKGNKEILDGETIHIDGTDKNRGQFKVKLYNYDVPRYNPYLY